MPDITCCINDNCPLRFRCYRWMAEWSDNQSIANYTPIEEVNIDDRVIKTWCKDFLKIHENAKLDGIRVFARERYYNWLNNQEEDF